MTGILLFTGKLTLFLAGGAVLALALRRHSAATRHLVWALTLGGALLFGVAARFAPALPLAVPDWRPEPAGSRPSISDLTVQVPIAPRSMPPLPALLSIFWLGGAAAVALWLAAGHLALASVARSAAPAGGERWRAAIGDARAVLGIRQDVRVLLTPRAGAPLTAGTLRPMILLPADAAEWPDPRQRAAILHELAHVARRDCAFQLVANLALALYWFHPLVWIARRQLRRESELATDDRVIARGMVAPDYARQLLDVAHAASTRGLTRLVAAGMACPSHLERRLRALLDHTRFHGLVSRRLAALAALWLLLLFVPLAAARPAWQAKESPAANVDAGKAPEGAAWNRDDAYILKAGNTDVTRTSSTIKELVAVTHRLGDPPYLWVRLGSHEYLIRDESVLREAVTLWAPVEAMKPEQREVSAEEERLDKRIDAIEDHKATAAPGELEELRARDKVVSRRERELDEREEALEKVIEVRLRQLVDEAIRSGRASRLR